MLLLLLLRARSAPRRWRGLLDHPCSRTPGRGELDHRRWSRRDRYHDHPAHQRRGSGQSYRRRSSCRRHHSNDQEHGTGARPEHQTAGSQGHPPPPPPPRSGSGRGGSVRCSGRGRPLGGGSPPATGAPGGKRRDPGGALGISHRRRGLRARPRPRRGRRLRRPHRRRRRRRDRRPTHRPSRRRPSRRPPTHPRRGWRRM